MRIQWGKRTGEEVRGGDEVGREPQGLFPSNTKLRLVMYQSRLEPHADWGATSGHQS